MGRPSTTRRPPFRCTGAHAAVTCQQCHGDGVFAGKSTVCVPVTSRTTTRRPIRTTAPPSSRPTAPAATPRRVGRAPPSTTTRAVFPVYSGYPPAGGGRPAPRATPTARTTRCSPASACHEHSQSSMDSKHSGRSGYRYDSQALLQLPSSGEWRMRRLPYRALVSPSSLSPGAVGPGLGGDAGR